MPIYEYYCHDNHRIYQFYAKTLAQGRLTPKCPDNPKFRMEKMLSPFSFTGRTRKGAAAENPDGAPGDSGDPAEDARMEAAMSAMESEFANVDENDPRAMGRMMRRMAELTGEKIDGEMEEVVRKLEEGMDPEKLDENFGDAMPDSEDGMGGEGMPPGGTPEQKEARHRFRARLRPPSRDPKLYDYE